MTKYITPREQMLIIEKIYRSTDSITSTRKFNEQHGNTVGRIGEKTLPLNDFYRSLKATGFFRWRIKKFIREITGKTIDLY